VSIFIWNCVSCWGVKKKRKKKGKGALGGGGKGKEQNTQPFLFTRARRQSKGKETGLKKKEGSKGEKFNLSRAVFRINLRDIVAVENSKKKGKGGRKIIKKKGGGRGKREIPNFWVLALLGGRKKGGGGKGRNNSRKKKRSSERKSVVHARPSEIWSRRSPVQGKGREAQKKEKGGRIAINFLLEHCNSNFQII